MHHFFVTPQQISGDKIRIEYEECAPDEAA